MIMMAGFHLQTTHVNTWTSIAGEIIFGVNLPVTGWGGVWLRLEISSKVVEC